jgi:tetratricopeptide (TPR) repeat protein
MNERQVRKRLEKADGFARTGQWEAVVRTLQPAIDGEVPNDLLRVKLVQAQYRTGDYQGAVDTARGIRAATVDQALNTLWILRASMARLNRLDEVPPISEASGSMELMEIAYLQYCRESWDELTDIAERLRSLRPTAVFHEFWLGWADHQGGHRDRADERFRRGLAAEPGSLAFRISHVDIELAYDPQARQEWRGLREQAERSAFWSRSVRLLDARVAYAEGRFDESARVLAPLPEDERATADEWHLLSQVRWRSGDLQGAEGAANAAEARGLPQGVVRVKALIASDRGEAEAAEALARAEVESATPSEEAFAAFVFAYVLCHHQRPGAADALRELVRLNPGDEDTELLLDTPASDTETWRDVLVREDLASED